MKCFNAILPVTLGLSMSFPAIEKLYAQASDVQGGFTGLFLADVCSDKGETDIFCIGYLKGFSEMHTYSTVTGGHEFFCVPETVSVRQMQLVFLKYAENHPEELHNIGSIVLLNSLTNAFPCVNATELGPLQ